MYLNCMVSVLGRMGKAMAVFCVGMCIIESRIYLNGQSVSLITSLLEYMLIIND